MEETDGPKPIVDLSRLSALIYVFGINKDIWKALNDELDLESRETNNPKHLDSIVENFRIKEGVWNILDERHGFQTRKTFGTIGGGLGVTGARIQQLEKQMLKKIRRSLSSAIILLSLLDAEVKDVWPTLQEAKSANEVVLALHPLLIETGWNCHGRSIRHLLLALRAMVQTGHLRIESHLPYLTYLACKLSPAVLKHSRVAQEEGEQARCHWDAERQWRYVELAEFVLQEAGEPLHYMTIAKRAEELGKRDNFSLKAIHNVLLSDTNKFAYVDQGTYGLTAWGLASVDTYTNIIADALKQAATTLSFGDLFQHVNATRPVKPQTFQMTLDMNPRFYQSKQEQYGLRAWLPAREKQTLRTPDWLVETSASYERVTRAAEHGYDIAAIVASDIPQK